MMAQTKLNLLQRSYFFGDQSLPVIDDIIDVPVPEWCSASDAVLWIMLKRPPVAFKHVVLVNDGALSLGFDAEGRPVRDNPNYFQSWGKLHEAGSQGIVGLRGRPAIGLQKIVLSPPMRIEIPGLSPNSDKSRDCKETYPPPPSFQCDMPPTIQCEKWGDLEVIPASKLKEAGSFAFLNIPKVHFLSDGMMYASEYYPPTAWAYDNIEVNVPQLIKTFHSAESKGLRVGTEVNFLHVEAPQKNSTATAAVTPNAGGRPRKAAAVPPGAPEQLPLDTASEALKQINPRKRPISGQDVGRPPHHGQDAFIRELVHLADLDSLPSTRGVLAKHMMEWAALKFGDDTPSETTIKDWLKRFDWRRWIAPQEISSHGQGSDRSQNPNQEAFIRELVSYADQYNLPEENSTLIEHMTEWARREYGTDALSETMIGDWLQRFDWRNHLS